MKSKKFAVIGQLPPEGVANSGVFLQNLKDNPSTHPLLLYSSGWPNEKDVIRLQADPGKFHGNSPALRSNLAFLTGLRIARERGLDYFLYIESDCRVGCPDWDELIWDEFISGHKGQVMGGTPVMFNPVSWSYTAAQLATQLVQDYMGKAPIAMTGNGHLAEIHKSCVFVNGALGIFDVKWLVDTFGEGLNATVKLAQTIQAWDYELGIRLWDQKDEDAFNFVRPLERIFSGYGEVLTKEAQRIEWLKSGDVLAVHQVKSAWPGPTKDQRFNAKHRHPEMDIMIVSFNKDIQFLEYTLASIEKFASGFNETVVVVPTDHLEQFEPINKRFKIRLIGIDEPPGVGFNNHQAAICSADYYCSASLILHMDSDCIFQEPVKPSDYLEGTLPELMYRPYSTITDQLHYQWKAVVERTLKFPVENDFMTRHPAIHHRWLYPMFRSHVERLQGLEPGGFRKWVLQQKNDFPQGFAEFPSLGAYAFKRFFGDYSWYHVINDADVIRPNKLLQGWNREGLDHKIRWKDWPDDKFASCRQRFDAALNPQPEVAT